MKSPSKNQNSCKCNNARFMQPLLPNFLTTFSIPMAFVKGLEKELKGHELESVVLTTEDEPHRHWVIKVKDGHHFKDGWKEFCEHYGLKVGDILVFNHQTHLLFQVVVFDPPTACQRIFSSSPQVIPVSDPSGSPKATKRSFKFNPNKKTSKEKHKLKAPVQGISSARSQNLKRCRVTLTSYYFKRGIIQLPKYFLQRNGLKFRSSDIKLIDGNGLSWKAKLKFQKSDSSPYICGNWKKFQTNNNLSPRDILCFELIEPGKWPIKWPIMKCYRLYSGNKS